MICYHLVDSIILPVPKMEVPPEVKAEQKDCKSRSNRLKAAAWELNAEGRPDSSEMGLEGLRAGQKYIPLLAEG